MVIREPDRKRRSEDNCGSRCYHLAKANATEPKTDIDCERMLGVSHLQLALVNVLKIPNV